MASAEDISALALAREHRATKGKRISKLLGEQLEQDEQFWGNEVFKEEENDQDYHEEGEAVDEFDSDFSEDVSDNEDDMEKEVERQPVKKKKFLLGSDIAKKKNKKKVLTSLERPAAEVEHCSDTKATETKNQDATVDIDGERTVRKSTRTAVIVRQAEREALRALQPAIKPVKRRKEGEERRMTQEEMLLEAAQTEIMNLRNLERVLALEEEVKKKAVVHKSMYEGPQILFHSKDGVNTLEFTEGAFPSELFIKYPKYSEKSVCVVTGQPAKYRDPQTGLPYATLEAFKIIRERFSNSNRRPNSSSIFYNDPLFNLVLGHGFCGKGKRTTKVRKSLSRNSNAGMRLPSADQHSKLYSNGANSSLHEDHQVYEEMSD